MSKQVIVLGMHRSYTTLIAEWLHENGVHMFDPTLPVPRYYEDPEIFALHERFLASQQTNWLHARAPFSKPVEAFTTECHDIWDRNNARHSVWGWKDPRTCILFETLWAPFSKDARFIVVYRHPAEVVESLLLRKVRKRRKYKYIPDNIYGWYLKRNRIHYDIPHLKCWNYYNASIIQILSTQKPGDYIVVNAESLPEQEKHVYQKVSEDWGIQLQGKMFSSLIKPSQITHSFDFGKLETALVDQTEKIFETLQALRSFQ